MLTKFKKSFTIALAVVMCLSTVCASAATWRIKDYYNLDLTANRVTIVYEEIDDAGRFTGRMAAANPDYQMRQNYYGMAILDTMDPEFIAQYPYAKPYAKTELRDYWFDLAWPNAEYGSVYADGKYIGVVAPTNRNGKMGLVNYKDVDYTWEVAAPFGIYSIEKAWLNVGGVAQWFGTKEMGYPVSYTGRNADVKVNKAAYGFGVYNVVDGKVVNLIPDKIVKGGYVGADVAGGMVGLTAADLAPTLVPPTEPKMLNNWAYGNLDLVTKEDIKIPRSYEYTLVGPAFDANGVATPFAKTVKATEYVGDLANFGCNDLISVVRDRFNNEVEYCEITWTAGGYENASPHAIYEYLTIDGVVMDGSAVKIPVPCGEIVVYLPCIAAYTGAVANVY